MVTVFPLILKGLRPQEKIDFERFLFDHDHSLFALFRGRDGVEPRTCLFRN